MEKEKRKIRYHPSTNFQKSSVIIQEASESLLNVLQKSVNSSLSRIKSFESFQKTAQPNAETLEALESLQKAIQPVKEVQKTLEELKNLSQQTIKFLDNLELQRSLSEAFRTINIAVEQFKKLKSIKEGNEE